MQWWSRLYPPLSPLWKISNSSLPKIIIISILGIKSQNFTKLFTFSNNFTSILLKKHCHNTMSLPCLISVTIPCHKIIQILHPYLLFVSSNLFPKVPNYHSCFQLILAFPIANTILTLSFVDKKKYLQIIRLKHTC